MVTFPAVAGGKITVALSELPPLAQVNGWVVGTASGFATPLILVRADANTITATEAVCTHMHCTVGYNGLNKELECPCHGSHYELNGMVIDGPATMTGPLVPHATTFDGTTLVITI